MPPSQPWKRSGLGLRALRHCSWLLLRKGTPFWCLVPERALPIESKDRVPWRSKRPLAFGV